MGSLAGVTLSQFFKIGIIAVLFIVFAKFASEKSGIAGLQAFMGKV